MIDARIASSRPRRGLVGLLALGALALLVSIAHAEPVTASGRVTRADTGEAVVGAEVRLLASARRGPVLATVVTDAAGQFAVAIDAPRGRFLCDVSPPGLTPRRVSRDRDNRACDLRLEPKITVSEVAPLAVKGRGPGIAFLVRAEGEAVISRIAVRLHVKKPSACGGPGTVHDFELGGRIELTAGVAAGAATVTATEGAFTGKARELDVRGTAPLAACDETVIVLEVEPAIPLGREPLPFRVVLPARFDLARGLDTRLLRFTPGALSARYRSTVTAVDVDVHTVNQGYSRASRTGLSVPVSVAK